MSRSLFLGLQMGDPDSAIDCANADRAVAPGQNLARRTLEALFFMCPVEEATFAEQRAEDAGSTVRRADLPHDHGRCVLHPVDVTVGLPHRRAQTAAHVRRHIVELLWLPSAGSVPAGFDSSDCFKNTAHSSMGDLITIEAAFSGRIGLEGKLIRGPDWACIELVCRFQDRYAPALLLVGDGPVERRGSPIPLDAGMHDQTEMERPDFSRNGDLQHRRKDQFRLFAGDGGDHCFARRSNADGNFVATLTELNHQTLAEAVVGRCQKENSHGFAPYIFGSSK